MSSPGSFDTLLTIDPDLDLQSVQAFVGQDLPDGPVTIVDIIAHDGASHLDDELRIKENALNENVRRCQQLEMLLKEAEAKIKFERDGNMDFIERVKVLESLLRTETKSVVSLVSPDVHSDMVHQLTSEIDGGTPTPFEQHRIFTTDLLHGALEHDYFSPTPRENDFTTRLAAMKTILQSSRNLDCEGGSNDVLGVTCVIGGVWDKEIDMEISGINADQKHSDQHFVDQEKMSERTEILLLQAYREDYKLLSTMDLIVLAAAEAELSSKRFLSALTATEDSKTEEWNEIRALQSQLNESEVAHAAVKMSLLLLEEKTEATLFQSENQICQMTEYIMLLRTILSQNGLEFPIQPFRDMFDGSFLNIVSSASGVRVDTITSGGSTAAQMQTNVATSNHYRDQANVAALDHYFDQADVAALDHYRDLSVGDLVSVPTTTLPTAKQTCVYDEISEVTAGAADTLPSHVLGTNACLADKEEELRRAQLNVAELTHQVCISREEVNSLQRRLDDQACSHAAKRAELESKLQTALQERAAVQYSLSSREKELRTVESKLKTVEVSNATAENSLMEIWRAKDLMSKQLVASQTEHREMNENLASARREIVSLQQSIHSLTEAKNKLDSEKHVLSKELSVLQSKLISVEAQQMSLKASLAKAEADYSMTQETLTEVWSSVDSHKVAAATSQDEVRRLTKQLQEMAASMAKLTKDLREEKALHEHDAADVAGERWKLMAENSKATATIKALHTDLERLDSRRIETEKQLHSHELALKDVQEKCEAKEEQRASLEKLIKTLKAENADLTHRLVDMQGQLTIAEVVTRSSRDELKEAQARAEVCKRVVAERMQSLQDQLAAQQKQQQEQKQQHSLSSPQPAASTSSAALARALSPTPSKTSGPYASYTLDTSRSPRTPRSPSNTRPQTTTALTPAARASAGPNHGKMSMDAEITFRLQISMLEKDVDCLRAEKAAALAKLHKLEDAYRNLAVQASSALVQRDSSDGSEITGVETSRHVASAIGKTLESPTAVTVQTAVPAALLVAQTESDPHGTGALWPTPGREPHAPAFIPPDLTLTPAEKNNQDMLQELIDTKMKHANVSQELAQARQQIQSLTRQLEAHGDIDDQVSGDEKSSSFWAGLSEHGTMRPKSSLVFRMPSPFKAASSMGPGTGTGPGAVPSGAGFSSPSPGPAKSRVGQSEKSVRLSCHTSDDRTQILPQRKRDVAGGKTQSPPSSASSFSSTSASSFSSRSPSLRESAARFFASPGRASKALFESPARSSSASRVAPNMSNDYDGRISTGSSGVGNNSTSSSSSGISVGRSRADGIHTSVKSGPKLPPTAGLVPTDRRPA